MGLGEPPILLAIGVTVSGDGMGLPIISSGSSDPSLFTGSAAAGNTRHTGGMISTRFAFTGVLGVPSPSIAAAFGIGGVLLFWSTMILMASGSEIGPGLLTALAVGWRERLITDPWGPLSLCADWVFLLLCYAHHALSLFTQ